MTCLKMNTATSFVSGGTQLINEQQDEILDVRDLQKWNCIIEPTIHGAKSYGGLYLGDVDCAQDPYLLQKLKIGALLSVIDEPQINLPECMNYIARETIAIPDCASESLINYFPRCSEFMERQRGHTNVMVHCFAGISRSASVVIAYLMEKFGWNYERTLGTVKAVRKQVKPNYGFIQQLQKYEVHLKHKLLQKQQLQQIKRPFSQQAHIKTVASVQRDKSPGQIGLQDQSVMMKTETSRNRSVYRSQEQLLFQSSQEDIKPLIQAAQNHRYTMSPQKRQTTNQNLEVNNKSSILQVNNKPSSQGRGQDYTQSVFNSEPLKNQTLHLTQPTTVSENIFLGKNITQNNNNHNNNIQNIDMYALEQEIIQRQNSLAELQKKYLELQQINNKKLEQTKREKELKKFERPKVQNTSFQFTTQKNTQYSQPINQSAANNSTYAIQKQIYHYPFQTRIQ